MDKGPSGPSWRRAWDIVNVMLSRLDGSIQRLERIAILMLIAAVVFWFGILIGVYIWG